MIPRITHQTAASVAGLSPGQLHLRRRLLALHPEWEHRFHDDAACRDLIRRTFPAHLPFYDGYATAIQRSDMFRVAVVFEAGGFYLDLDMECLAPLDPLLGEDCVVAEESTLDLETAQRLGHAERLRIANYMFGSRPRHPFWLDLLAGMVARAGRPVLNDHDVLETTGPGLFSTIHARVSHRHQDLRLLEHPDSLCPRCGGRSCAFGPHARHLHKGSWRQGHRPSSVGPQALMSSEAIDIAAREGQVWRGAGGLVPHTVVLRCYEGEPTDGLSSLQRLVAPLGSPVYDSRTITDHRVVVPGLPFLYEDRISQSNRNCCVTTFESSRLPTHWVDALNRSYHHVIVPHERVRRVFEDSGVRLPVSAVQQSFPRLPRMESTNGPVRVGFLGVPVRRKNLEGLYLACRSLIPRWPDLRLSVHVATWYDWLDRAAWDDVRADPMVESTLGRLDDSDLARWFAALSCYVYPSRAEGWSFTPRQSLFLGVPTVLSDIDIHRDLAASGTCEVIPARGSEPAAFEGGVFGAWDRIEPLDIADAIARVLSDPHAARQRAEAGARWIESRWLQTEAQAELARVVAAL